MAVASSGQISLGDMRTEFGDSGQVKMSDYYGKGSAPASGEVQMSDFYGASNADGSSASAAAPNVTALYDLGLSSGDYWIDYDATAKLVYCDLDGTYTGDSSRGYVLYQSFNNNDYISSNAWKNTQQSNFNTNGWATTAGVVNTGYTSTGTVFYTSGSPASQAYLNTISTNGQTWTRYAIKIGSYYSACDFTINGSFVVRLSGTTTAIRTGTINTSGANNKIQLQENNASIGEFHYIFFSD